MILIIRIDVKPVKLKEFRQVMESMVLQSKSEQVSVYQRMDEERAFYLVRHLESKENLDEFLAGEKFELLMGAAKVLGEKVNVLKASRIETLDF